MFVCLLIFTLRSFFEKSAFSTSVKPQIHFASSSSQLCSMAQQGYYGQQQQPYYGEQQQQPGYGPPPQGPYTMNAPSYPQPQGPPQQQQQAPVNYGAKPSE
jgi:hypothetical protein